LGENIHNDGSSRESGESFAGAGKAWSNNDVVGLGHKIGNGASHVWHSVFG
jgi:hypothetical protein